jgi:thioredoxin-related protein
MKRTILFLLILFPVCAFAQVKFEESTIKKALERAEKENKGLVIDVISGKVDKENIEKVFSDKTLTDRMLQNFIPVRIDMAKPENEDFVEYISNLSYPLIVFLNPKGNILSTGHLPEIAMGFENFGKILDEAIKVDLEKKTNTKQIEFLDLDYKQALEMSKKTNKPLFVDCHFVGCGPCKRMVVNVFNLDRVADFYNQNFICLKLDRDKDPHGVCEKFKVFGFPAFLYINPAGELITKDDGFKPGDEFIALGRKALKAFGDGTTTALPGNTSVGSTSVGSSSTAQASGMSTASVPMSSSSAASTSAVAIGGNESNSSSSTANLTAVQFEKLSLEDALAKAKRLNKAIYVDMSATWCQPCKMMKEKVFPDPQVVEYLNKNFININFECDIDSALSNAYRDKYYSTAFPTHLLIDKNGELIHKFVGYISVPSFLAELNKGVLANTGLNAFTKRYNDGERSSAFMNEYITMLANANEGKRAAGLASEYLKTLSVDELANKKTFYLINEFVRDLDGDLAKKILANKPIFEKNIGEGDFVIYERMLWTIKGLSFVKEEGGKNVLDKVGFDKFIKQLKASGVDKDDYVKMTCTMENYQLTADWNSYVDEAISYMKTKKGKANLMLTWNWGAHLQSGCKDSALKTKYLQALEPNYELIKKTDRDQAIVWAQSMKILVDDLKK